MGAIKQLVKYILAQKNYKITRIDQFDFFEPLLYLYLEKHSELFFIQIGANDGKSFDPLYDFVVRNARVVKGIAIEPIRDTFALLLRNYKQYPNIRLLNVAIHRSEKEMAIWRVDPNKMKSLPDWSKGIASFNKNHHLLSGTPSDVMISEQVNCMSLEEVLVHEKIHEIDLLQIDTEGYDAEIIFGLNFEVVKPKIIHFEHSAMARDMFSNLTSFLRNNGYEIVVEKEDATAYQPSIMTRF